MNKYQELENRIKELQEEVEHLKRMEKGNELPKDFDRESAIKFLFCKHESWCLSDSFDWDSTPQGEDYWCSVDNKNDNGEPIPDEAVIAIQRWIILSYRKEYGD